jgi:prolipoprotein diacylglyceryltransferase
MNYSELSVGPMLFSVGDIFVLVGVLFASWLLARTAHEKGLSLQFFGNHFFLFFFIALFFGRTGSIVTTLWSTIQEKLMRAEGSIDFIWIIVRDFLSLWQGGIDFFWAIAGFSLVFLFFCAYKNEHPLRWLDAFSLPIVLFLIFYEIGGFFSGWDYGAPTSENFPLSISYDMITVRYSGPIHPVQLYASVFFFLIFSLGVFLWTRKIKERWQSGVFGGMMLSLLFLGNGFLDFFRGETGTLLFSFIPLSQLLYFVFAIAILSFMLWRGHFSVFSHWHNHK